MLEFNGSGVDQRDSDDTVASSTPPQLPPGLEAVPYLIEAGELEQAFACVQQTLAVVPTSAEAHCEMAALSLAFRDLSQTETLLIEAERLGGRNVLPRITLLRGDMAYFRGDIPIAEAAYTMVRASKTDNIWLARALLGLGRIAIRRDDGKTGALLLQEAAELDRRSFLILQVCARALEMAGDQVGALEAYRAAMKIKSDDAGLLNDLGALLSRMKRLEEAAHALRIAVRLRPNFPGAHNNLGLTFYQLRRIDEAADAFEACLKYDPDNAFAQHMVAATRGGSIPDRASAEYVQMTFDNFAADFETKLARLDYRAPELLTQALAGRLAPPAGLLSIFDAGCGTGLCGPLLRPYAAKMVGVDLSAGMLKKAEARGIYDRLVQGDIVGFADQNKEGFNLIVAADVLIYFGDLREFMAAAEGCLKPGGTLAFTVEHLEDAAAGPFKLNAHGRYSHTEDYIRTIAAEAGLRVGALNREVLRREGADKVFGLVVLLDKPACCCGRKVER